MHPEARAFVSRHASAVALRALDVGGRDVNGNCRDLFPNASWTVLDRVPGPGVHVVADARTWKGDGRRWDLVLCTEVLEHNSNWELIFKRIIEVCAPGAHLLVTCAGPDRPLHSGLHGGPLEPGEYYLNIDHRDLAHHLSWAGWQDVEVEENSLAHDLYASAVAWPS